MATYQTPGVYVEEISKLPPSVAEVSTAIPAFIGCTEIGPTPDLKAKKVEPIVKRINTLLEYETAFGGAKSATFKVDRGDDDSHPGAVRRDTSSYDFLLYYAVSLYFKNGGGSCYIVSVGNYDAKPVKFQFEAGLAALEREDEPTLILLTDAVKLPDDYYDLARQAMDQCAKLGDRFTIIDVIDTGAPDGKDIENFRNASLGNNLKYGAAYYPFLQTMLTYAYRDEDVTITADASAPAADASNASAQEAGKDGGKSPDKKSVTLSALNDPSNGAICNTALYNRIKAALGEKRVTLPPGPAIAGVYACVDRDRGVWKAPANVVLGSVIGPTVKITHEAQEDLNIDPTAGKSINAIRSFTGKGTLVWGARTLAGNDNEWRYVSVRRLFNMIEESAQKSTAFAVFEPNDAATWLKVKAMIESYLYGLWQQGALAGSAPDQAYFVNIGLGKTMTAQDILEGRMIVEIGIAAVRPAEFIILRFTHKLQQA